MLATELRERIAAQPPAHALERPFYTDPELFAVELERLFCTQWLFVGHASRIPNPGDYFTYQIGTEPLLLIRGEDSNIHALFNLCRHKGSLLCRAESGNVKKLVCPYHQWVYETDGRLFHARFLPDDCDKATLGLDRAHLYNYEGLLLVCLAETPPPFPQPKASWIAPYALTTARVAHIASYDVRANWKIVLENFLECYHCGGVHPEYTRLMAGAGSSYLSRTEEEAQAGRSREESCRTLQALGLDYDRPQMQFRKGFCTQSLDGKPVAPLMGTHRDYDGTMLAVWIGWTFEMEANPDHVVTFRFTPRDTRCTNVEVNWLVRGDATEGVDYDRERLTAFWKITGEQDWDICEAVQAGVESRHYRPGPLSEAEGGPKAFLRDYLARLAAL